MCRIVLFITLIVSITIGCKPIINVVDSEEKLSNEVVYAVNKDGLYLYDYQENKSNKICDLNEVFIPKSLQSISDSVVIIAVKPNVGEMLNSVFFVAVNLNNGHYKTYKQVSYIKIEGGIRVSNNYFDMDIKGRDTILLCNENILKQKGIMCCGFNRYIINAERQTEEKVFAKNGDIYMKQQDTSVVIMNFEGESQGRRKLMRGGYSHPSIDERGKKVVCQFKEGFGYKQGTDIFVYDIESGIADVLIENDQFYHPRISKDSKFVLLAKNSRIDGNGERLEEVHIYKISTNYSFQITESNNFIWR